MRDNTLQKVVAYFFKYIWLVCAVLITINMVSMGLTAYKIMKNSAQENLTSLKTELEHRISVTYNLLEGISNLPLIGDTSISVADRVATLKPFAESFGFWMIGLVNMDGMTSSTLRHKTIKQERDYIPRIQHSHQREMTDVFPAGATNDLNYTVLMPVIRNDEVVSIVFTSTLLSQLNTVVTRKTYDADGYYLLLDSKLNIISHPDEKKLMHSIHEFISDEVMLYKETKEKFTENLKVGKEGSYVSWFNDILYYTFYTKINNSHNWMLIHRVRIFPTFMTALIGFTIQLFIYIAVFALMYIFGTMYMKQQLQPMDNILKQVIDLNKEVLNSDKIDTKGVSDLIKISKKGLKDDLTGLPTRMLFRQVLNIRMRQICITKLAAIFFIDMDNLKTINDSFGHKYGDSALNFFGTRLQQFAVRYSGLSARYGGDEFVVFVENIDSMDELKAMADDLLNKLRGNIDHADVQHSFHASIGIAVYPLHSPHIDVIIQLADIALYETKQRGKNGYTIYTTAIGKESKKILTAFICSL